MKAFSEYQHTSEYVEEVGERKRVGIRIQPFHDLSLRRTLISVAKYFSVFISRYGCVLTGLVCLMLGYLLVWHRGFYLDDYLNRVTAVDVTGHRTPVFAISRNPVYPARELAWVLVTITADLLTNYELLVRIISALGIGFNALLLGWLVYRILGSQLAAIVVGWLFLMPLYAYEALIWAGSSTYISVVSLALLFLHTCWNALVLLQWDTRLVGDSVIRWIALGVGICVFMMLIAETLVIMIALASLLSVVILTQRQRPAFLAVLRRTLAIVLGPTIAVGVVYLLLYRGNAAVTAGRGGLDVSVSGFTTRAPGYFEHLWWLTISSQWGEHLTSEVLHIGSTLLFQSWKGIFLFVLACVLVGLTALTWKAEKRDYEARYLTGVVVLCIGVIWFVTSLLFPAVFIKGQILEYRMLYFPFAGASMAVGAATWLIVKIVRQTFLERVFIVATGAIMLLSTIGMLGFDTAFAARFQLDQKELAAFTQHVSAQDLPTGSVIVPFALDERLSVKGPSIGLLLAGVFEAPWSARAEMGRLYHRTDLQLLTTNRWVGMRFALDTSNDAMIRVQGYPTPIDRMIVFTYQNGDAFVITSLVIRQTDGTERSIAFPLATTMSQHGVPTISNVLVLNDTPTLSIERVK